MIKVEKIEKITKNELINMFINFDKVSASGVTFASVVYHTDESGSVVKNKQKQLQKFVRNQITLGSNYEARINRDLARNDEEANFTAQHMTGKEHLSKMVVYAIKNPENKMMCCVQEHNVKSKTQYIHNGARIEFEKAKELGLFQPSFFEPKKTAGRGEMSTEKDFKFFTLGFDKVISLTMNKTKYLIADNKNN